MRLENWLPARRLFCTQRAWGPSRPWPRNAHGFSIAQQGKTLKKARIFHPYRTPKLLGKEGKTHKKKQENPLIEKRRKSQKTRKGREGQRG